MFTLTSAAALQIQQAADTSESQDMALRVADLLNETVLDFVELEAGEFNFIFID